MRRTNAQGIHVLSVQILEWAARDGDWAYATLYSMLHLYRTLGLSQRRNSRCDRNTNLSRHFELEARV